MAVTLDPKQTISFEELLMSQVVEQEALTRLLVEKGVFTKKELMEMVRAVDLERKLRRKGERQNHQKGSIGSLPARPDIPHRLSSLLL